MTNYNLLLFSGVVVVRGFDVALTLIGVNFFGLLETNIGVMWLVGSLGFNLALIVHFVLLLLPLAVGVLVLSRFGVKKLGYCLMLFAIGFSLCCVISNLMLLEVI